MTALSSTIVDPNHSSTTPFSLLSAGKWCCRICARTTSFLTASYVRIINTQHSFSQPPLRSIHIHAILEFRGWKCVHSQLVNKQEDTVKSAKYIRCHHPCLIMLILLCAVNHAHIKNFSCPKGHVRLAPTVTIYYVVCKWITC